MNARPLFRWLVAALFALVLATGHLLDQPSDIDAARDTADEAAAAPREAAIAALQEARQ
jgi:hypothetical protein